MKDHADAKSIRLILLDDQVLLRTAIARLLAAEPGFEIVGQCGTRAEAMEMLRGNATDVVLLDYDLGVSHQGQGFMCAARSAGFGGRFLVVANTTDVTQNSALALKLGASGVFLKSEPPEHLALAIRCVAQGAWWLDQNAMRNLADRFVSQGAGRVTEGLAGDLTDRERKALLGVLSGLTNKKIAANTGLSEGAVKNILQALFSKAGVRNRSQLVRMALQGSLRDAARVINSAPRNLSAAGQSSG